MYRVVVKYHLLTNNVLRLFAAAHRDLKPENICISKDGLVKIVDMGMIRELPDGNATNLISSAVGTGPYIPPQGGGTTHDEYSVGVMLCELMCGKRPFEKQEKNFSPDKADSVAQKLIEDFGLAPWYESDKGNIRKGITLLMTLIIRLLEPFNSKRMKCDEALVETSKIKVLLEQWKDR